MMTKNRVLRVAALMLGATLSFGGSVAHATDPAVYSFVVLGDDRVPKELASTYSSTANQNQLNQSADEIAALQPSPTFVFFTGDLVLGAPLPKGPKNQTEQQLDKVLSDELNAWLGQWFNGIRSWSSIDLIPIPGNHELDQAGSHTTLPGAEGVWLGRMNSFIPSDNGPSSGDSLCGNKTLVSDQKRLTYSFDAVFPNTGGIHDHFILINTDPASPDKDPTANSSTVPVKWIQDDLQSQRTDKAHLWHLFALGHKEAYKPANTTVPACGHSTLAGCGKSTANPKTAPKDFCDGLNFYPGMRDQMFDAFNTAPQVAAYFAGHIHLWDASPPPKNKFTWQIIAGNAGMKPYPNWNPKGGAYFGFTVVTVMQSGRVMIASYGRNFDPNKILGPVTYPTLLRDCFCIDANGGPNTYACNSSSGLPIASNATLSCSD